MGIEAVGASPSELRGRMVDELVGWGSIRTAEVQAAMRAVLRHVFVPDAPVEDAYAHTGVATHPGPMTARAAWPRRRASWRRCWNS